MMSPPSYFDAKLAKSPKIAKRAARTRGGAKG
jgi:hypothetical protein